MTSPERSVFREHALKKYLQRQNQGIILRLVSPPTFIFCWILLLLLLTAAGLAWWARVPVFMSAEGLLVQPQLVGQQGDQAVVVLFVSPSQQTVLRTGQTVNLSIGSSGISANGTVARISTQTTSPDDARQQYNLQGSLTQLITAPSLTVIISINASTNANLYAGSLCVASVQTGTRSVLSLIPGVEGINQYIHSIFA